MNPEDILTDPQWIAFQAMLDENPASHDTRAVLADWLENFGHPWARVYRWMFRYRRYPLTRKVSVSGWFYEDSVTDIDHAKLLGLRLTHKFDTTIKRCDLMGGRRRMPVEIELCRQFHKLPLRGKENV